MTKPTEPKPDAVAKRASSSILGANPFVRFEASEVVSATGAMLGRAMFKRSLWTRRGPEALREVSRIVRGESEIAPEGRDDRFSDSAWTDNALYRRWMQAYLLGQDLILDLPDELGMQGRRAEQARFMARAVADAMAPTNLLAGNPAALKRAIDTKGMSLLSGARHFVRDLVSNGGFPSQVDASPFKLGENIATTAGAVVYRSEALELIQYEPATAETGIRPVVIIPPQINKYYVLDLAPGRSMIEHAVNNEQQVFAISWRNPQPEHSGWDLAFYVSEAVKAIEVALGIADADRANVVAASVGGITTATLLAQLAVQGRDLVNSVTFLVSVLDADEQTAATTFASDRAVESAIQKSRDKGVLEGRDLDRAFAWLRPNDLVWNYWVNNYLMGQGPPAVDVLAWNADSTNLPAALHADLLSLFQTNALTDANVLAVNGTSIDLKNVTVDAYVLGAFTDRITPWQACYRTPFLLGGDAEYVMSASGQIDALVCPPDSPKAKYLTNSDLPRDPNEWLAEAELHGGSWWDHWLLWLEERDGGVRDAPEQVGSHDFPPIEDGPGSYVRE